MEIARKTESGEVRELVESARLESVCTPKGYRGFESHPLRQRFSGRSTRHRRWSCICTEHWSGG